jgi:hypothetical protein
MKTFDKFLIGSYYVIVIVCVILMYRTENIFTILGLGMVAFTVLILKNLHEIKVYIAELKQKQR